jgi:sigma-B regulation protein RsbU (phosphoserine phosphatase)
MAVPSAETARELDELRARCAKLSSLIGVGAIISSSLDLEEVLNLVMAKAREVMEAEACSVLLLNEESNRLEFELTLGNEAQVDQDLKEKIRLEMGQGVAGWAASERRSVLVADAAKDRRWFSEVDRLTGSTTRSLMAVPLLSKGRLIGVAEVINPLFKPAFDQGDLELLETFCAQVAVALDNARFHQAFLNQQRLKEQLRAASSIQRSFLPPPLGGEENASFNLEAASVPAQEVGGDLYDYFLLPGRRLAVLVGDVSGKGVGAALFMARVVSEFRYLSRLLIEPRAVMNRLNNSLAQGARHGMFVTAVYWLLDLEQGLISYANCGHVPSLWRRAKRSGVELVDSRSGPPLGIVEGYDFRVAHLEIEPGDSLIMITDGVIEAWGREDPAKGYDRLIRLLDPNRPGEGILTRVLEELTANLEGRGARDDLTLLALTWKGPSGIKEEEPEGDPVRGGMDTVKLDTSLRPRMMRVVRDVAGRVGRLAGMSRDEANAFKLAVDEACTNVLRHAYGGDVTRRLRLSFHLSSKELAVELHDFGLGFDPQSLPPLDTERLRPGGLGVHLIKSVMDEISYVHSETEGNTLRLTKRLI